MIEINSEHIRYLEVGDTFYETGYGHKINLRVIEKPHYSEDGNQLLWKAIDLDTYKIIDYLITVDSAHMIHLYYTDETWKRIQKDIGGPWMTSWLHGGVSMSGFNKVQEDVVRTDDGQILYKKVKYKPTIPSIPHHLMKTTGVNEMVNVVTDVPLNGKTWDKAWIDENIPF